MQRNIKQFVVLFGVVTTLASALNCFADESQTYTITNLGNPFGGGSSAFALNDNGQVVGSAFFPDGTYHAFLWQQSTGMIDLGTFSGDVNSVAVSINNEGQIVGIDQGAINRGFLWQSGSGMTDIGAGTGWSVVPRHINDQGQIEGNTNAGGFIYTTSSGMNLVTIPGIPVADVAAMNNNGQMVVVTPDTYDKNLYRLAGKFSRRNSCRFHANRRGTFGYQ